MRIRCEGELQRRRDAPRIWRCTSSAKLGADGGVGYAVEYAGSAIEALDVEGRLTALQPRGGAGRPLRLIAPDATTFDCLRGRPHAPQGEAFEAAVRDWQQLASDADAAFEREVRIDAAAVVPTITWGTSPDHAIRVDGRIPDPAAAEGQRREAYAAALDYMGLRAGDAIAGTPVDWVFIGSCANSRLSDLRAAAAIARGRRVAAGVTAWVVPGSENVKRAAEAEGLHEVFESAGFAMARARLQHVRGRQRRAGAAAGALRLHLQPQLRRPAGPAARAPISRAPPWPQPPPSPAAITDVRGRWHELCEPFTVVSGPAVPLLRANVDTDVIIRIERLTALPPQTSWAATRSKPCATAPTAARIPTAS